MKHIISAVSVLAMLIPSSAVLAKPCHFHKRHLAHHRTIDVVEERSVSAEAVPAKKREITIARQAPAPKVEVAEVHLDAGPGRTLRQLLADDLGADVDWGNERLADNVARGSYHGSRDVVARELLANFDFAIFHKDAKMRVVVVGLSAQTDSDSPSSSSSSMALPVSQAKGPPEPTGCKAPAICVTPPQPAKRPNAN